ncbi:MAG: NADH:ubiquinone reductase (Na(+)-transporting) subunit E, partial [Planctomycetes bacterium]|nr:NADH:ubiquinone reductase (Na(+)-transporting) subunit E [Planctomycetota bacterium]
MLAVFSDEGLASVLLRSIFVENILLSFFLGMCSYLAVSKRVDSAIGLGIAVVFVQVLTVPMNWVLQNYVLGEGALAWAGLPDTDLSYLQFLTFIASIAAVVQVVEMAVDKFSPKLYAALGIFLPLIAVNCAILGGSLFMVER